MKLNDVWVVEGGLGSAGPLAAFELRVEPTGWTLVDVEEPSVERQWSWAAIGGLQVVRGAGKTPDGRAATALDVIVNGWPVRVLVATQDLPNETIAMLGAFAPVGHPLRASPRVQREPTFRRFSAAGRRYAGERLRARPAFLLSAASTRLRSALVVVVVLGVTVAVASIAGVATSAQAPTTTSGAAPASGSVAPPHVDAGPGSTGAASSSQPPGPSSSLTSVAPALAAAGNGKKGKNAVKPALAVGSTPGSSTSGAASTTRPVTDTTKATTTTKPTTSTSAAATTTTTRAPTTTTTRAPRPPRTTTTTTRAPTTTTTRAPTTTTTRAPTTTTTKAPPPTTTQPPPTTTQPPPTTTQPSPTTTLTTAVLGLNLLFG